MESEEEYDEEFEDEEEEDEKGERREFESVSTGCFLVKPQKKKSESSLPSECNETTSFFQKLLNGKEKIEQLKLRHKGLEVCWESVAKEVQKIQNEVNQSTFQSICQFISVTQQYYYENLIETLSPNVIDENDIEDEENEENIEKKEKKERKIRLEKEFEVKLRPEIPTAIVSVGMNILDHEKLLSVFLRKQIEDQTGNSSFLLLLLLLLFINCLLLFIYSYFFLLNYLLIFIDKIQKTSQK